MTFIKGCDNCIRHIIKVICQSDMFLYEDKSYIKKSGFEAQKIGELRSMTYSCADDEKHRPSKATLFLIEFSMLLMD